MKIKSENNESNIVNGSNIITEVFLYKNILFNNKNWKICKETIDKNFPENKTVEYSAYYVESDKIIPPRDGWKANTGANPPPNIELNQEDLRYCTVSGAGSDEFNGIYFFTGNRSGIAQKTGEYSSTVVYKKIANNNF